MVGSHLLEASATHGSFHPVLSVVDAQSFNTAQHRQDKRELSASCLNLVVDVRRSDCYYHHIDSHTSHLISQQATVRCHWRYSGRHTCLLLSTTSTHPKTIFGSNPTSCGAPPLNAVWRQTHAAFLSFQQNRFATLVQPLTPAPLCVLARLRCEGVKKNWDTVINTRSVQHGKKSEESWKQQKTEHDMETFRKLLSADTY